MLKVYSYDRPHVTLPRIPCSSYTGRKITWKKGEKALKNASFWVINFKIFRGGVFRPPPPLHNLPTNLFVENYIKNGGKGLKNASFWVINSPRPPQTCSSGKKNDLKKGGGEKKWSNWTIYTPECLIIPREIFWKRVRFLQVKYYDEDDSVEEKWLI